jgi:hypothetical protein
MGLSAYLICSMGDWSGAGHTGEKIMILGMGLIAGLSVYLISSYWMKNEEMIFLLRMLKRKG